ncbi:MAG: DUF2066 domain-containing protein [Alphaproteobacteria bacterium]|nr:DUF2066 domain-containing protein [Alphaproteobacteria bacterium SS10]
MRFPLILIALTAGLFLAIADAGRIAHAQKPSLVALHTVAGIDVDVTADTAVAARDQAIATAQNLAFRVLMQRLTLLNAGDLPVIERERLDQLIKDFEISGERSSSVQYLGTFTVRFIPDQVRRYLRETGIGFSEAFRPPMLVLPIIQDERGIRLWDAPNPWLGTWQDRNGQVGQLTLIAPRGGLEDLVTSNVDQALNGDLQALKAMRERYRTEAVLVAVARLVPATDTNPLRLAIEFREYGRAIRPDGPREGERIFGFIDATQLTLAAGADENPTALLTRGRDAVIQQLTTAWKQETVVALSNEFGRITVALPVGSLGEWQQAQRRLAQEGAISRVTVLSMAKDRVRLALDHLGSVGELRRVLAQRGLRLSPEPLSLDPALSPSIDTGLLNSQPRLVDGPTGPQGAIDAPGQGSVLVSEPTYLLTLTGG